MRLWSTVVKNPGMPGASSQRSLELAPTTSGRRASSVIAIALLLQALEVRDERRRLTVGRATGTAASATPGLIAWASRIHAAHVRRACSRWCPRRAAGATPTSVRSGPTVPCAAVPPMVWQPAHASRWNTSSPAAAASDAGSSGARCVAGQPASEVGRRLDDDHERPCGRAASPQNSAHSTRGTGRLVGGELAGRWAGRGSCPPCPRAAGPRSCGSRCRSRGRMLDRRADAGRGSRWR